MRKWVLVGIQTFLGCFSTLEAIDYSPWFERVLYIQGRALSYYEGGQGADLFRNEFALKVTPWMDIRAEFELDFFKSRNYSYRFEASRLAGQYRFLNDITGDPVTLVGGVTAIIPSSSAKHEYELFYSGNEEVEFHLIIGKELSTTFDTWCDRAWVDIGYGLANENSPWWRTQWQTDWNLQCSGVASLFIKTVAGAGTRSLEFGGIFAYPIETGILSLTVMRRPIVRGTVRATGITLEYTTPLAF